MTPTLQLPRTFLARGSLLALPEELKALGLERPLLVTDSGLVKCGVFGRVCKVLDGAVSYAVFDAVPENPTYDGVDRAAEVYRSQGCDGAVAIGGGSVIDTAKLVAVLGGHTGTASDYVGHSDRVTAATAPLIVIPTTAGTGSEASPDAGIHPDARTVSSGITSRHVIPRVALCDPETTVSLPPRLTAATGLDALSHCIEGFLATTFCPPADAMALDGIRRVFRYLPAATANGDDIDTRLQMMVAAFEGGVAIGKGLGPAHAIAIACGDQGLHHAMLSAVGILASLPVMESHAQHRVRAIAEAMGLKAEQSAADGVRSLMRQVGLPISLRGIGYSAGDVSVLARDAAKSHFNLTSPYAPSETEFARMIGAVLD
jgi:alcohol dehydrogenase class IV